MKIRGWALKTQSYYKKQEYEGWLEVHDCNYGEAEIPCLFLTRKEARNMSKEGPVGDRRPKVVRVEITIKEID